MPKPQSLNRLFVVAFSSASLGLLALTHGAALAQPTAEPPAEPQRLTAEFRTALATARHYAAAGLTLRALELLAPFKNGGMAQAALAEDARIRFASHDYAGAAAGYRRLLDLRPGTPTVQRNLLMALYRDFQDRRATALLAEMGPAADSDARARTVRGLLAGRAGDVDAAIADLTAAEGLDEADPQAPYELGKLLLARGDAAAAVPSLREAVRRDPEAAPHHYNLGLALTRTGETEAGEAALRRGQAIVAKANEKRTRSIRAIALAERAQKSLSHGDAQQAVRDLEHAVRLLPGQPGLEALLERARASARSSP